jgi:glycine/D-amino acid oxidase-like deaminating enzyme
VSEVGWDDAVADWPGLAPLDRDATAEACVVGLGASGLAAIEALLERGVRVVGVDAGRVAAGAAGRNGGFLIAGPALFLHDAIARWDGSAAVDLYGATLAELDRLAARLGPDVVRRVGSIRLAGLPGEPASEAEARDRAAELADCAAQAAALRAHGIAVEDYAGPLGSGIFLPDDAATNPAVRATRIAAELAPRAQLHEHTEVTGVGPGLVRTKRGTVRAERVVVALDGKLGELVPAVRARVRTARLQMVATAPLPHRIPCPVYGRWGYDYAQQLPDGRLFAGGGRDLFADAEWTTDATPSDDVQAYIETVAARMAGGPVRVTARWAASVGFTADARPVCAEVADGVVAVGGYNGTGNLVGPVAARAAVALALDGTAPPTWAAGL